jgi:hypothetical protein
LDLDISSLSVATDVYFLVQAQGNFVSIKSVV